MEGVAAANLEREHDAILQDKEGEMILE